MALADKGRSSIPLRLRAGWGKLDPARRVLIVVLLLLLVGLLVRGLLGGLTSLAIFSHPFQLDESEGMIVAETMLLDKGTNIYAVPTPDLFVAAPYPPLFYLLGWPLQHLAGDAPTFKAGRAISIVATLLAGVAIFGIVVAVTKQRLGGALAAAAWWSLGLVTFWGGLVKPDMLALTFGLGGLWWLVARPPSQVWWALPFFWGAFYTKQTAIAAAVAAVGWLLFTRPKTGLVFGAAYASGVVIPTLLLNQMTDGGYFYHMFTVHDLPWSPERALGFAGQFLGTYGLLLVPGMLAILVAALLWLQARLRKQPQHIERDGALLLFFYLGMSLFAASGTGTLGGNHNHLLEWAAASCLGIGLVFDVVWCGPPARRPPTRVSAAGVLVCLVMLAQVPLLFGVPVWLKLEFGMLSQNQVEGMTNIVQYVTNNGGRAYSDNVGLLLLAGKPLWTTDPYTQTHATFFKRWDETKLVEAITRKSFSQVILRIDIDEQGDAAGDVSPRILQAVRDNYKLDQRNVENIYVPK
jgi:hypothetical protein